MIRFEEVTIASGNETILSNVSFDISAGTKAVLTGSSGPGKTILLLALAGVVPLQSGCILLEDTPVVPENLTVIRSLIPIFAPEYVLDQIPLSRYTAQNNVNYSLCFT
jgi:ABC-type multidrug transport system fused ATPase/permease subunit